MNPAYLHDIGSQLTERDGGAAVVVAGNDGLQTFGEVSRLRHLSAKVVVCVDGTLSAGETARFEDVVIEHAPSGSADWQTYQTLDGSLEVDDTGPRGVLGLDLELGGAFEAVRLKATVTLSKGADDTASVSVVWILGPRVG